MVVSIHSLDDIVRRYVIRTQRILNLKSDPKDKKKGLTKEEEKLCNVKMAIISIGDAGQELPSVFEALAMDPKNSVVKVCEVAFNDVSEGDGCITKKQASAIAKFAKHYKSFAGQIIIRCEDLHRAAGVAAALLKYFNSDESTIFKNAKYCPNMTCYHAVLSALQNN